MYELSIALAEAWSKLEEPVGCPSRAQLLSDRAASRNRREVVF